MPIRPYGAPSPLITIDRSVFMPITFKIIAEILASTTMRIRNAPCGRKMKTLNHFKRLAALKEWIAKNVMDGNSGNTIP